MATNYLTLGPSPTGEQPVQIGHPNYAKQVVRECTAFRLQLERTFPEHTRVRFTTKTFPHGFGNYKKVCVIYDEDDEISWKQALECETETPEEWDAEALRYLAERAEADKSVRVHSVDS